MKDLLHQQYFLVKEMWILLGKTTPAPVPGVSLTSSEIAAAGGAGTRAGPVGTESREEGGHAGASTTTSTTTTTTTSWAATSGAGAGPAATAGGVAGAGPTPAATLGTSSASEAPGREIPHRRPLGRHLFLFLF
jgi:hypothetical protein